MAVLHGNIKKLAGLAALLLVCLLAVGWGYTQVRAAADDRAEYRIVNDEYSQVLAPADPEAGLDQTLQLKAGEPLYGVRLLFATYERVAQGQLTAQLLDGAGQPVATAACSLTELLDNTFYGLVFDQPYTAPEDGAYTLHMSVAPLTEEDRVGLHCSQRAVEGFALAQADGQVMDATAALQYMTDYTGHWPSKGFLLIGLLCTLGIVGAAALLWWGKTPRLRAAFCLAGAALGIAFALATPPLGGPDEYVHFAGSYAAASRLMGQPDYDDEGGLWVRDCDEPYVTAETGPADAFVYHRVFSTLTEHGCARDLLHAVEVRSPSSMVQLLYLPQTLGVLLARLLGLGFTGLILAGRLCNLAAYLALTAFALGRTRRGRSILLAVGLLPGCLQQAASFSPDALVLGLAFAFAAHCLGMVWADGPVRPAEAMPLLVLAAALGPAKAVYVLLVGLVLLVPARRFAGLPRWAEPGLKLGAAAAALAGWGIYNLEYVRYILRDVNEIAVFGLAAAVILLLLAARPAWNWWKSRPAHTRRALAAGAVLLLAAAAFAALKALHLGGDLTPEQLAEGMQPNGDSIYTWSVGYTLRHLPALAKLLVGTLCAKLPQLLQEMMGACPGEPIVYGAELSWAITIGLLFTTLLAACRPVGTPARLERGTRLVPALALLGVCGLLVLACLTWTPVNYTILFGLQGRYFLPVLPLALLLWGENRWLCLGRDLTRPLALAQAALCGLAALQTMALFAAR